MSKTPTSWSNHMIHPQLSQNLTPNLVNGLYIHLQKKIHHKMKDSVTKLKHLLNKITIGLSTQNRFTSNTWKFTHTAESRIKFWYLLFKLSRTNIVLANPKKIWTACNTEVLEQTWRIKQRWHRILSIILTPHLQNHPITFTKKPRN